MIRKPTYNVFITEQPSREASMSVDSGFHTEESDYTKALNNLRKLISDIEVEIYRLRNTFYLNGKASMASLQIGDRISSPQLDELQSNHEHHEQSFLKTVSDVFINSLSELDDNSLQPEIINSEAKIVTLLNNLRTCEGRVNVDNKTLIFLTEFWENVMTLLHETSVLRNRFRTNVFRRLKRGCQSRIGDEASIDLTERYKSQTFSFMGSLSSAIMNTQILTKSFANGIRVDLFDSTNDKLKLLFQGCEWDCFPVLRIVPEVICRIEYMCALAREWINRDQEYINDVYQHITEVRCLSLKRAEELRQQKKCQSQLSEALEAAHVTYKTSKRKIRRMETQIHDIERQLKSCQNEKLAKSVEMQQKEGMADFLSISISQLRRNYSLQSKRTRILKHLKYLDQYLDEIDKQLHTLEEEYDLKAKEKHRWQTRCLENETRCITLNSEFKILTVEMNKLETDFTKIQRTLEELESVHSVKTSPEILEDFYEQQEPVQLAKSLQNAILKKRKDTTEESSINQRRNSKKHVLNSINANLLYMTKNSLKGNIRVHFDNDPDDIPKMNATTESFKTTSWFNEESSIHGNSESNNSSKALNSRLPVLKDRKKQAGDLPSTTRSRRNISLPNSVAKAHHL